MKKWIKKNSGMSILEIVIAVGIISVAAGVYINQDALFKKTQKKAEATSVAKALASRLLNDVLDNVLSGKKLCNYISTNQSKGGIGPININLRGVKSNVIEPIEELGKLRKWKKAKKTSGQGCDANICEFNKNNNYWECYFSLFKFESQSNIAKRDFKKNYCGYVKIGLKNLNLDDFSFKDASWEISSIDVKKVGFEIETNIKGKSAGKTVNETAKYFLWLPAIGNCKKSGMTLSLTGMAGGDETGNTIYNTPGFKGNKKDPLNLFIRKSQVRRGVLINNQFLETDFQQNVPISCNETYYKCPGVNKNERIYDPIEFSGNISYNSYNNIQSGYSTGIYGNISISIGSYKIPYSYSDTASDGELEYNFKSYSLKRSVYFSNSRDFKIKFSRNSNPNMDISNKICRKACPITEQSSPNSSVNIKITYSRNGGESNSYQEKLACTACFMKNCDQFGLGTFGPMNELPSQPLDSNIPECNLKHNLDTITNLIPYYGYDFILHSQYGYAIKNNNCIKANKDSKSSKFHYGYDNCNKSLPVLCYNYGHFFLVRNEDSSLKKAPYYDAPNICRDTGKERFKVAELARFFGLIASDPNANSKDNMNVLSKALGISNIITIKNNLVEIDEKKMHSIYNLATQGMFLAPQLNNDFRLYDNWATTNKIASGTSFWVALQYKKHYGFIALPPFIRVDSPNFNRKNEAIFFDGNKFNNKINPYYVKVTSNLAYPVLSSGKERAYVLVNSLKYRGLVSSTYSSMKWKGKIPFLCRGSNGKFYKSSRRSNSFSDGEQFCKQSGGGLFVAPSTSVGWLMAFDVASRLPQNRSFPLPDSIISRLSKIQNNIGYDLKTTVNSNNAVWVNIKTKAKNSLVDIIKNPNLWSNYIGNYWSLYKSIPPWWPKKSNGKYYSFADFEANKGKILKRTYFNVNKGTYIHYKFCYKWNYHGNIENVVQKQFKDSCSPLYEVKFQDITYTRYKKSLDYYIKSLTGNFNNYEFTLENSP